MTKRKGHQKRKNKQKPEKRPKQNFLRNPYFFLGLIAAIVILTFAKTSTFDYVNIDDGVLIYENPVVNNPAVPYTECFNAQAFTPYYKPLTYLSWKLQYNLFNGAAGPFHTLNWILHLFNAFLLFYIAQIFFKKIYPDEQKVLLSAFLLTAFFAINPLRIESVAWVTERKDVLFSLFFLSSWLTYLWYLKDNKSIYLIAGAVLYLCSGLSKSMGITLIAVLFLTDLWFNLKIDKKMVLNKIPHFIAFLLLLFLFGYFSFDTSPKVVIDSAAAAEVVNNQISDQAFIKNLPKILQWALLSSFSFVFWLVHSLIPVKLSLVYPHEKIFGFFAYSLYIFPLLIITAYTLLWIQRKKLKVLLGGLLFLGITLSPVLTYTSVGQAIFLSDRYTYIPSIGLFFILVFYINKLEKSPPLKYGLFGFLLLFYGLITMTKMDVWKNSETLCQQILKVNPKSYLAYLNLGKHYKDENRTDQALNIYNKGIEVIPGYYNFYTNRGKLYFDRAQVDLAMNDFNKSLSLNPNHVETLANRGAAYGYRNELDKAFSDLNKALEKAPNNTNALKNRGLAYYQTQQYDKVIGDFQKYLEIIPNDHAIINAIGSCYNFLNQLDLAIENYSQAIAMNNTVGVYHLNRSRAYYNKGNLQQALNDALYARQLGTAVDEAYLNALRR